MRLSEPRVLAYPGPQRVHIQAFYLSFLPGPQWETWVAAEVKPSMSHCHGAKQVDYNLVIPFLLSELKKFVYMISCQLHCPSIAWNLQVHFLFSKWAPQMWTLKNSTRVKRLRCYANAVIMLCFEISKGGLSNKMKQINRFPFWEIWRIFSRSLCLAKPDLLHPRIWNAASCCPQLVRFGTHVTTSENLRLYETSIIFFLSTFMYLYSVLIITSWGILIMDYHTYCIDGKTEGKPH